jgi:ubiquinone/menaquinone biosynthesis C-methylase UbiE
VYEDLYELHAQSLVPTASIGDGDFDLIGRIELSALLSAGLEPEHTLVDFGCGTGRLAIHVIPRLPRGAYIGVDISTTMLTHARASVDAVCAGSSCQVSWKHQTTAAFDLPAESVDFFAAFSVFTHMEHEDSYRYLLDGRRVARPGARFVLSCLPMDLAVAREIFLASAGISVEDRWKSVRSVTTTQEYMGALAEMAGWRVDRWFRGDEQVIPLDGGAGEMVPLGQSVCVLAA